MEFENPAVVVDSNAESNETSILENYPELVEVQKALEWFKQMKSHFGEIEVVWPMDIDSWDTRITVQLDLLKKQFNSENWEDRDLDQQIRIIVNASWEILIRAFDNETTENFNKMTSEIWLDINLDEFVDDKKSQKAILDAISSTIKEHLSPKIENFKLLNQICGDFERVKRLADKMGEQEEEGGGYSFMKGKRNLVFIKLDMTDEGVDFILYNSDFSNLKITNRSNISTSFKNYTFRNNSTLITETATDEWTNTKERAFSSDAEGFRKILEDFSTVLNEYEIYLKEKAKEEEKNEKNKEVEFIDKHDAF